MKKAIILSLAVLFFCALPGLALAADEINTSFFGNKAVDGYDTVAYFTEGKPVEGKKAYTHKWKDANWRFASQENLELFKADPEKYAPQYGGYCAWAVAQGSTADADPELWKIVDGKLYLNFNQDIQDKWEADIPGFIEKADKNWPGVLK
jgi:YHS domain-containing protein